MPRKIKVKKPAIQPKTLAIRDAYDAILEGKLIEVANTSWATIPKYRLAHMYRQKRITLKIKKDVEKRWRLLLMRGVFPQMEKNVTIKLIDTNPTLGVTSDILILRTDRITSNALVDLFDLDIEEISDINASSCARSYGHRYTLVENTLEIDAEKKCLKCNLSDGYDDEFNLHIKQFGNRVKMDTDVGAESVHDVNLDIFSSTKDELILFSDNGVVGYGRGNMNASFYIHVKFKI